MRQRFPFLVLLALVLASCAGPATLVPVPDAASAVPAPTANPVNNCLDARQPTPDPEAASLFPPVSEQDQVRGKAGAYVTVLVYSDFQCVSCAKLADLLNSFLKKYPEDLRVVFRHFPLVSLHDKALLAAQAAEAAGRQGKFWEMHDFLFSRQADWAAQTPEAFQKWIVAQSAELGLDPAQFETDLVSPENAASAQKAWEDGQKIPLPGVPVLLVNEEIIKWQPALFEQLESLLLLARLPQKQFSTCPPMVIAPAKQYTARLKTSRGEVTIRLFADRAPNTVNNFVFLAQQGWYENIPFFRVVPGFLVRTGDPSGTGLGGPGYFIPDEKSPALRFDRAGMVGMVNAGPDTNGSQFFITLGPAPQLNQAYTVFGQVIDGQEVLSRLTPRDPTAGVLPLPEPDLLLGVTIEEK